MNKIIEVKNLSKNYGKLKAVDNISFTVEKGEVFGLLGENGAGKTTTLEMIEGLRKPTDGKIIVLNYDVHTNLFDIKEKIGVQLQSSAYFEFLKLREILELFSGFYRKHADIEKLFGLVDLKSKENQYIQNLSGGQKQRFSIIASLINDPEIVFLDEPTTGLDPIARRKTWDIISEIKKQGKTIILTTHYMEEAEILCDRIAIMEKGKIVALDKTHKLLEQSQYPYKIDFILENENQSLIEKLTTACLLAPEEIKKLPGKEAHFEIHLKSQDALNQAINLVQQEKPESLSVGRTTLEDLFIELTGKSISEEEEQND